MSSAIKPQMIISLSPSTYCNLRCSWCYLSKDELANSQARLARNNALLIEFQNNLLTLNQWLEKNGEPKLKNGFGDKYYYELAKEGWEFGKPGVTVNVGGSTTTAATT